ncbi:MAG: DUF6449 domain-containing protein, partial [Monoglobales bacterium]
MISKTSLFNKGIYKSVVRRNIWGSLLYFLLLFVITTLPLLIGYNANQSTMKNLGHPVIYTQWFVIAPVILAIIVPTVVGLLVFRIIHSKKSSIFTHSLPVCRNAIFISTVAGALTLMAVPVILNGLILTIMSLTAYSALFTAGSCMVWILINLLTLFIMFACTSFVSVLTGNSFAMVVLNLLIHTIVPIAMGAITVISTLFLYGFSENAEFIWRIISHIPVVQMVSCAENLARAYENNAAMFDINMLYNVIGAIILYGASLYLYKKRNLETAEDVAGFKVLNPIFKYLITTLGTISVFSIFSMFIEESPIGFTAIVLILTAIFYFALEMILKKSLKVFKSYKGFIGFCAVFGIIITIFSATSFFGFETRVPSADDVKSVVVYEYYNNEAPSSEQATVIEEAVKIQSELTREDKIYTISPEISRNRRAEYTYNTRINIKYNLKNGKVLSRTYLIEEAEKYEVFGRLYKVGDYRQKAEQMLTLAAEDVYRINLHIGPNFNAEVSDRAPVLGLLNSIKTDLQTLDYNQVYCGQSWGASIDISVKSPDEAAEFEYVKSIYSNINPNFKNTIKWLEENGYAQFVGKEISGKMYLSPVN